MSLHEKLAYEPYAPQFEEAKVLSIKSIEAIRYINKVLMADSPESDWEVYSWYLGEDEISALQDKSLIVSMAVSWYGGLPFYKLTDANNNFYDIAEFYLEKYKKTEVDFLDSPKGSLNKKAKV